MVVMSEAEHCNANTYNPGSFKKNMFPRLLHMWQGKESGESSLCLILLQDPGPGWKNHPSAAKLPRGKGVLMPKVLFTHAGTWGASVSAAIGKAIAHTWLPLYCSSSIFAVIKIALSSPSRESAVLSQEKQCRVRGEIEHALTETPVTGQGGNNLQLRTGIGSA